MSTIIHSVSINGINNMINIMGLMSNRHTQVSTSHFTLVSTEFYNFLLLL